MAQTVTLHYAAQGSGPPVVLLHGFPFDHTIWRGTVEALHDAYRVITPDLRGHGKSPVPDGVYAMESMARDVIALLDALGVARAVWVGHSMGGYVALAALRDHPERVAGGVLLASHPFADSPEKAESRRAMAHQALAEGSEAVLSGMLPVLFRPGTNLETIPAHIVRTIMLNTAPEGVAGALRGMAARPDAVNVLREPVPPKAIIAGREDQIVKLDDLEELAAAMPHLALKVVDGAGHLPMIEQPQPTAAALRALLDAWPAW